MFTKTKSPFGCLPCVDATQELYSLKIGGEKWRDKAKRGAGKRAKIGNMERNTIRCFVRLSDQPKKVARLSTLRTHDETNRTAHQSMGCSRLVCAFCILFFTSIPQNYERFCFFFFFTRLLTSNIRSLVFATFTTYKGRAGAYQNGCHLDDYRTTAVQGSVRDA